jgi:hypothetical protein
MTREKGQLLYSRLQPVLNAVHLYVQALGDMNAVFDREFAFVSAGDSAEKEEVNRLATLARSMLYLNFEDATLASIALVRFGTHVENRPSPFQGKVPHRDDGLATRLVLLTDFVRAKRLEYNQMCGLRL